MYFYLPIFLLCIYNGTMKNIKWFFPETLTEVEKLYNEGYKAHGGGTFLVKTNLKADGYFNLAAVPELKKSGTAGDSIILGSALTYTEAADCLEKEVPGNFISAALSAAAATPLRNRITLGGSIYAAPKWSDLIGPLKAAGASLKILPGGITVSVSDYYSDRELRHSGIITEVIIPKTNIKGGYYRFTQTHFDYPFFTVSISVRKDGSMISVLTGTSSGPVELSSPTEVPEFNKERGISGEYIRERAAIELSRLLKLLGGK